MTVIELKELIANLPDDMKVVMDTEGDTFTTCCFEQSLIEKVTLNDEETGEEYDEDFFFIRPCTCYLEDMPVEVDENVNLN